MALRTATNPQTGERVAFVMGEWVPYRPDQTAPADQTTPPADQPPEEPSALQTYVTDPLKRGVGALGQAAGAIGAKTGIISPETAAGIIVKSNAFAEAAKRRPQDEAALKEIGDAPDLKSAAVAALKHPSAWLLTMMESLPQSSLSILGGLFGSVLGPAGTAGGAGAGSAATEYSASLIQAMQNLNVDLRDPKAVENALTSPRFMEYASQYAAKRAAGVGALDAVGGGVAGRLVGGARGVGSTVVRGAGEGAVQAGTGAAGEAIGQRNVGEYKPGDIVMEAAAELPASIGEVVTGAAHARRKAAAGAGSESLPGVAAPSGNQPVTGTAPAPAATPSGTKPTPPAIGAPPAVIPPVTVPTEVGPAPAPIPTAQPAPATAAPIAPAGTAAPKTTAGASPIVKKAAANLAKILPETWDPVHADPDDPNSPVLAYHNESTGETRTPDQHLAPIATPLSGFEPVIAPPSVIAEQVAKAKEEGRKEAEASQPVRPETPAPAPKVETPKAETATPAAATSTAAEVKAVEAKLAAEQTVAEATAARSEANAFRPTHTDTQTGKPVEVEVSGPVRRVKYADGTTREERAVKAVDRYQPIGAAVPEVPNVSEAPAANKPSAPIVSQPGRPDPQKGIDRKKANAEAAARPLPTMAEINAAAAEADPEPTEAQAKAGNYRHGHVQIHGIDIAVETPRGAVRRGKAPDGTPWEVKLPFAYGRIKRTVGADGEEVDTYIAGRDPHVYVVDQIDPATGRFDEHKAVFGTRNETRARKVYESGFSDKSGSKRMGAITGMPMDAFKDWLKAGDTTKPLAWTSSAPQQASSSTKGKKPAQTLAPKVDEVQASESTSATKGTVNPSPPAATPKESFAVDHGEMVPPAAAAPTPKPGLEVAPEAPPEPASSPPAADEPPAPTEQPPEPVAAPAASETPPAKAAYKPKGKRSKNTIVTDEAADKARETIRRLMSGTQLNSGMDPALLTAGITLAAYHIERGARSFADFSGAMIADMGEMVRPRLRQWYEAARYEPGLDTQGMTPTADVDAYERVQQADEPIVKAEEITDTPVSKETDDALAGTAQAPPDDRAGDAGSGTADVRPDEGERDPAGGAGNPGGGRRGNKGAATRRPRKPARASAVEQRNESVEEGGPDPAGAVSGNGSGVLGSVPVRTGKPDRSSLAPNLTAEPGSLTRTGSWREAAERNLDAIEITHRLDAEDRQPTPEEQAALAKFVGWGASELRNALFPTWAVRRTVGGDVSYDPSRLDDAGWRAVGERLNTILSPAELGSVLQSSQYAHYTSETVTRGIWSALDRFGFKGGKILEPGMGIGLFPITAPADVLANSHYTGIELDRETARTAKRLLPRETVLNADFVKARFPDAFFDLAIGNPPFANIKITEDPAYRAHRFSLHDYFFAKSLDKVRPGGVLAFVTSRYTMDKLDPKARAYLAERADLIGAIRLPNTAFKANAGAEVVTDVIFLRKRTPGTEPMGPAWASSVTFSVGEDEANINEYFKAHPEMVLGKPSMTGTMYAKREYTVAPLSQDLGAEFAAAVERLPAGIFEPSEAQAAAELVRKTHTVEMDTSGHREGQIYLDGGKLRRVQDGVGVELATVEKISANDGVWLKAAVGLRDAVREAQRAQLDDAPDWAAKLAEVNKLYDAMVKAHGPITAFTTYERQGKNEDGEPVTTTYRRYKNDRLLDMDLEGALIRALEKTNENTGAIAKGGFLLGRTLKVPVTPKIESARDALFVSMDQRGTLDLPHVAKLLGKSVDETIADLGPAIFEVPGRGYQTADEYLSGDVVTKLEEARVAADADQRFERNVTALLGVQPAPLTAEQINVELGAGWVDPGDIRQFAAEQLGLPISASYEPTIGKWTIEQRYDSRVADFTKQQEYQHTSAGTAEILSGVLNARPLKIYSGSKKERVFDPVATEAVAQIAEKMQDAFRSWVWTDGPRANRLIDHYNRHFNNLAPRQFDGSHLTLPGLSLSFPLHPHQKRAVWRIVQTGNTYLAHAVGAGKTLEMIVSAMEQRRLGLIRKPMFAVPNHMLNQFAGEFLEAYPAAKILVADDKAFHTTRRQRFMAAAALNDLDAVIVTHSAFGLLNTKPDTRRAVVDRMILDLQAAVEDLGKSQDTRITRQRLEQQIERIKRKFEGKASEEGKDRGLDFEDMGVDFLHVDEAHEFRKLDYSTDRQVKGIDPNGSAKALDLFIKTRWLEAQRPGRSMVFASGTPVTNTMAELYTLMRFMDEPSLEADGLRAFDAWATAYGRAKSEQEQNAAGAYELVTRFAKFVNVPEMMRRVTKFADILTSPQLGHLVKRPEVLGGGPQNVVTRASPAVVRYMNDVLLPRIKESREWKPSQSQPHNPDPMVRIITDARLSAIDLRFVDPKAEDDPSSKLNLMIDKIIETHGRTKDDSFTDPVSGKADPVKGAAQIVFSPVGFGEGVAASRGFDLRAHVMRRLAKAGIKAGEVAWMGDYSTDAKKQAMFKEMRAGTKRILFGSPKNMGTGVNVQKRLKALHYMAPPWYPADVEQPHGRILRQGNQNQEVELHWYATKGTYDSTGWGMVARKARFIEDAFAGDASVREIDDVTEVSQYEMASALAAGDERAIRLANLNTEIGRLELRSANHRREQINKRYELRWQESLVTSASGHLRDLGKAIKAAPAMEPLAVTVEGQAFTKPSEGGKALYAVLKRDGEAWAPQVKGETQILKLGEVNGLPMLAQLAEANGARSYQLLSRVGPYEFKIGVEQWLNELELRSASAPITALVGKVEELPGERERVMRDISQAKEKIQAITAALDRPFAQAQELASKIAEAAQLRAELAASGIATEETAAGGMPERDQIEGWENEGGAPAPEPLSFTSADLDQGRTQLVDAPAAMDAEPAATLGRTLTTGKLSDPEWAKIRKALDADLALMARQLAGSRIQTSAIDSIMLDGAAGRYIGGTQLRNLVTVSLLDADGNLRSYEDLLGTLRHEVIHFLKASGVIPRGSWAALESSARTWRKTFGIDDAYAYQNLTEAQLDEEAIAEAYNHWGKGQLKLDPVRATGMRAIARFLGAIRDRVRKALGMERIPTPQEVFEAIERGDFGAKNPDAGIVDIGGVKVAGVPADRVGGSMQITAYHGSPHSFDRFDMSKLGTGEGAQAYGHGLYFAENPKVAESYKVAGAQASFDDKPLGAIGPDDLAGMSQTDLAAFASLKNSFGKVDEAIGNLKLEADINPAAAQAASTLQKWADDGRVQKVADGSHYTVDLAVTPDDMLDWDKPLAEQSDKVRRALADAGFGQMLERAGYSGGLNYKGKIDGRKLYERLALQAGGPNGADAAAASSQLLAAGIHGIRYLDGGSRSDGKGTYNYVIFDDRLVDIKAKTHLPRSAASVVFSQDDIAGNMRQLEGLNYALIQKAMSAGMRGKAGSLIDHTRRVIQDRFLFVRRAEEAVEAATGAPLPEEAQPYLQEMLYHGKVAEAKFELDHQFKEPILAAMQHAGLKLDEVETYLYALHAPERNRYIASINPKFPDGGSGMTNADAQAAIDAVNAGPAEKRIALGQIRDLVRGMMEQRLQIMQDSGLISAATAQTWRDTYQEYVPLRGVEADPDAEVEESLRPKVSRGFMGVRRLEPRAYGRGSRANHPLATAFMLSDEAIVRAAKNEVQLAVLNLAQLAPDPNVWEVSPVKRQAYMATMADGTQQVRYRNMPHDDAKDTVIARIDGRPFRIQIHEPYMLRALSNLGAADLPSMMRWLATMTGTLSKLNTMWNPEFVITNAFMDAQAGLVNLGKEEQAGLRREVMGSYRKAMAGTWRYLKSGNTSTTWAQHAAEFRQAGGATAFNDIADVESQARSIEKQLAQLQNPRGFMANATKLVGVIERANTSIDNAMRLSTFVALRNRGYSPAQAARVAKNLTINFNRKGELGPIANSLWMFSNAAIQGTATMAAALRHKGVRRFVYSAVALGVAMELMGGGWEPPEDDDGTGLSVYDRVPEWEKNTNLIFAYGPEPGQYIKIRTPYGYGFFVSLGRLSAAYMRGAKEPTGDPVSLAMTLSKLASSFATNMLPGALTSGFVPTVVQPFADIASNSDWTGRKIMPDLFPGQNKPDSQLYYPSIDPYTKWTADMMNRLTGGNEFRPGLVDVSPESMSHVIKTYAGAAGAFVVRSVSSITRAVGEATGSNEEDPALSSFDVPFWRKVKGSASPWQVKDITYQRLSELEILEDEAKGTTPEARAVRSKERRRLALVDDGRKLRRNLSDLRKERNRTVEDAKLSTQEKRARTDKIAEREKKLITRFNAAYSKAVSARPQ